MPVDFYMNVPCYMHVAARVRRWRWLTLGNSPVVVHRHTEDEDTDFTDTSQGVEFVVHIALWSGEWGSWGVRAGLGDGMGWAGVEWRRGAASWDERGMGVG